MSGFLDQSEKERVRDAAEIVRVVGEHVALRPRGREFVGLCPFHDDHSPSMNVVPAKGIFHCFVCGSGGDVFSFVQKFHKMEFREALEYLADRFGVTLSPRRGGADGESVTAAPRRGLYDANDTASRFYRALLADAGHGRAARELIERRGISPAMVERFQIGAAPDRWDGLVLKARQLGQDLGLFAEAGLLKKREGGEGYYDVLRNRLVFPIQDQGGRVIAFGGRRLNDEDEPKYLNSPETRVFKKSATLYALSHASRAIQHEDTAIVTEGYTDAIACHQGGFEHAVATLGTALTREHAAILRRLCSTVVLLFDGDQAGQRAADRAAEVFFAEPIDVKIATLAAHTDAKDPDELLKREDGHEVFTRVVAGARDLLEYRFDRLREGVRGRGVSALSRAIDEEIARLVELGLRDVAPVRQALILRKLASIAGVDEETIRRAVPAGRQARPASEPRELGSGEQAAVALIRSPGLGPCEHLLGCVLCEGELWLALPEDCRDLIEPGAYTDGLVRGVAQAVSVVAHAGDPPELRAVLSAMSDDVEGKQAATALHDRIWRETQADRDRLHAHWNECVRRARLDRARNGAGSDGDALRRIEIKREVHTNLGADRRVLPRPR